MTLLSKLHDFRTADAFADIETPNAALLSDLLATACQRRNPMWQALQVARIKQLIAAQAWTDAALALTALQLPQWQIRRLAYDGGEWHCAVSRQCEMPEWLDQAVEAHHPDITLAILGALVEAAGNSAPTPLAGGQAMSGPAGHFEPVLADNFA
jgi:hypothetical protein